jgi:hypothetical protein
MGSIDDGRDREVATQYVYLTVIASVAKQSRSFTYNTGLPRRFQLLAMTIKKENKNEQFRPSSNYG